MVYDGSISRLDVCGVCVCVCVIRCLKQIQSCVQDAKRGCKKDVLARNVRCFKLQVSFSCKTCAGCVVEAEEVDHVVDDIEGFCV